MGAREIPSQVATPTRFGFGIVTDEPLDRETLHPDITEDDVEDPESQKCYINPWDPEIHVDDRWREMLPPVGDALPRAPTCVVKLTSGTGTALEIG